MKKILLGFILLFCSLTYANSKIENIYQQYPFKDPFDATIIGSSMLMMKNVIQEIPVEDYEIELNPGNELPGNLWLHKSFRFSVVKQKKKAPLIFLLAGTGSTYNSTRMKLFQRILYDAGFHVISLSSQMTVNFIVSASKNHIPGFLEEDSKDMYEAMKQCYQKVKKEMDVSEISLLGYSLGATNAVFLSKLDEKENVFQFKKVFLVNPAVNLYFSATKIDSYLNAMTQGDFSRLIMFLEGMLSKIKEIMKDEYSKKGMENIYKSFQSANLSEEDKAALVGLAFRINAIDLNYVTDLLSNSGVYTKEGEVVDKFTPMLKYFVRVNFADFQSYVEKIALPYYRKQRKEEYSKERLTEESSLYYLEEYLRKTPKIVAVTNQDELILETKDLEFLKNTMGNRVLIYPFGGHCGNMFYEPNVKIMLQYLKEGVFWNEE